MLEKHLWRSPVMTAFYWLHSELCQFLLKCFHLLYTSKTYTKQISSGFGKNYQLKTTLIENTIFLEIKTRIENKKTKFLFQIILSILNDFFQVGSTSFQEQVAISCAIKGCHSFR